MPERAQQTDDEPVFDRQFQVYKESYQQRGLSPEQAEAEAAETLQTGRGEPGGVHRDRE